MCLATPKRNQPNGKTDFTEKPSKSGEYFKKWSLFQSVQDNFMVVQYLESK